MAGLILKTVGFSSDTATLVGFSTDVAGSAQGMEDGASPVTMQTGSNDKETGLNGAQAQRRVYFRTKVKKCTRPAPLLSTVRRSADVGDEMASSNLADGSRAIIGNGAYATTYVANNGKQQVVALDVETTNDAVCLASTHIIRAGPNDTVPT